MLNDNILKMVHDLVNSIEFQSYKLRINNSGDEKVSKSFVDDVDALVRELVHNKPTVGLVKSKIKECGSLRSVYSRLYQESNNEIDKLKESNARDSNDSKQCLDEYTIPNLQYDWYCVLLDNVTAMLIMWLDIHVHCCEHITIYDDTDGARENLINKFRNASKAYIKGMSKYDLTNFTTIIFDDLIKVVRDLGVTEEKVNRMVIDIINNDNCLSSPVVDFLRTERNIPFALVFKDNRYRFVEYTVLPQ